MVVDGGQEVAEREERGDFYNGRETEEEKIGSDDAGERAC